MSASAETGVPAAVGTASSVRASSMGAPAPVEAFVARSSRQFRRTNKEKSCDNRQCDFREGTFRHFNPSTSQCADLSTDPGTYGQLQLFGLIPLVRPGLCSACAPIPPYGLPSRPTPEKRRPRLPSGIVRLFRPSMVR
jgi:hypothetical protein